MRNLSRLCAFGLCGALTLGVADAKKKPHAVAATAAAQAAAARSMGELAAKFKWGMTEDEVWKVIEGVIHDRYKDQIAKETDTNKQDDLRKKELDEVKKTRESLVKFDGKRTGWDVSIIDKEFQQRNDEAMITMWEKDQRRFLFFWNGKLYKQFIAFDSARFKDKSFEDFVALLEARYGKSETKFAQMKTKDEVVVDHVEWPGTGEYALQAVDQSGFYGNYCLRLYSPKTEADIEKVREEKMPKRAKGNALIDAVTRPDSVAGDKNANVVDQITGHKE
ncbi:MAG: hypothetical protein ABI321_10485 [Polyangia bacterium]